jgi:hypothetical protein
MRWGGVTFDELGESTAHGPLGARVEPMAEVAAA